MALRRFGAAFVTFGLALLALVPALRDGSARSPQPVPSPKAVLAKLPLTFAPDRGGYMAAHDGMRLDLNARGTTLSTKGKQVLRADFAGATKVQPKPESKLPGVINVLRGPEKNWRTKIPTFGRVRYAGIYPGIDAVFHGDARRLEYDFVVSSGADPRSIGLDLTGAKSLELSRQGDLLIHTGQGVLRQQRPVAYQQVGGRREPVRAGFRVTGHRITFRLGDYDRSKPLVVDPILSYSSYLGGGEGDFGYSIARGADGAIYIAGSTISDNFPSASRPVNRVDEDAMVTKLSADGHTILWANLYGGVTHISTFSSPVDTADDIAVDGFGNVFVSGLTRSTDFPVSASNTASSCNLPTGVSNSTYQQGFLVWISSGGTTSY